MKKSVILLLAAACLGCSVSCGSLKSSSLSTIEVTPDDNAPENNTDKTEILIYTVSIPSEFAVPLNDFNEHNEKYHATVREFFTAEEDGYQQAVTDMNVAILSGSSPDIVIAEPGIMDSMRKKDYFADLAPMIKNCDSIQLDDFLPNVAEGLTVDGEINTVFSSFTLTTAAAKKSVYGDELKNWTYSEAIDAYNNVPDGKSFLNMQGTDADMYHFMLDALGRDCIDLESCTCDFDGAFRETLEFLQEIPSVGSNKGSIPHEPLALINEDSYVSFMLDNILGVNYSAFDLFYDFEGSDVNFVGLPSINGNGSVGTIRSLYGIMETSQNKDGAWELLSSVFNLENMKDVGLSTGIPVTKEALEYLTSDKCKYSGGSVFSNSYPSHFDMNEKYVMTENELTAFRDYVSSVSLNPYYDSQLDSIIREEYLGVCNGEKTVDECVDALNNRIGLYLSEHE